MSPRILQFQDDLIALGFNPGPRDGIPGSRTRGAAHDFAERYGYAAPTGKVIPDALIDRAREQADRLTISAIPLPLKYVDLSDIAVADYREGKRPWTGIDAICLHQTGAPLVDTAAFTYHPGQMLPPAYARWVRHAEIDPKTKKVRYTSLRAHYGIPYGGDILEVHPVTTWGWSAQGISKRSISIEIAGFFNGIEGDASTRPKAPASFKTQSITPAQIASAQELIRYLVRLVKFNGGKIKYIWPHRIATNDRTPDPGSKVWQTVALPMIAELGLSDGGKGFTVGHGQPIPDVWSGQKNGIPY